MDVLCFGEPLVGFYPPIGTSLSRDVPIVKTYGGDTSNVALGIARLGGKSGYLTRVGNDPFGEGFKDLWQKNGVDTSNVVVDQKRNTGLYFVSFNKKKHTLTYYRKNSAASAITPKDISPSMIEPYSALHLSGISIGMSLSAQRTGWKIAEIARSLGKIISFDINYRAPQWKSPLIASEKLKAFIESGIDILEITDDEMSALGWGENPADIHKFFPKVKIILLKQGPQGATIISGDSLFSVQACNINVMDTVGAGDSFNAGFLFSILKGVSLKDAAVFATATAAHTCTGTGPLEKMPTKDEVEKLIIEKNYIG